MIFPLKVNLRYFELLRIFLIFSSFSLLFKSTVFSGSVVNHTPRDFTLFVCRLKFLSGRRISVFPLFVPIQITSVFLLLSLRPEASPKTSSVLRAAESDACEPFNIKVVSSDLRYLRTIRKSKFEFWELNRGRV